MCALSLPDRKCFKNQAVLTATTATAFAVFAYTLCPTVYAGDSGELALAAAGLGIPHPPGYPLFVLLGRLFVAAGSTVEPAYMTNLLCAAAGALTAGILAVLLLRLTNSFVIAAAGSLVLAFSKSFWSQATVTEVYTLACLGAALVLLCIELLVREKQIRHLYLLCYLAGLSLVLHQSMVLFLPAVGYAVLMNGRLVLRQGKIKILFPILLLMLGLSPYMLLPVRSHLGPVISWGGALNFDQFISYLLRRNYGALRQNSLSAGMVLANIQSVFVLLTREFSPILLLLSLPGIAVLNSRSKIFCRATLFMFFSYVLGMILIINPYPDSAHMRQFSVLYLPVYVIAALWIGAGMSAVFDFAAHGIPAWAGTFLNSRSRMAELWNKTLLRPGPAGKTVSGGNFLRLLFLLAPLAMLVSNYSMNNRSGFFDAQIYGHNIIMSVPEGGTLVVGGDNETFITAYLAGTGRLDRDIAILHRKGYIFDAPGILKKSTRKDLWKNVFAWERKILRGNAPVFFASFTDVSRLGPWRLERHGIIFEAVADTAAVSRTGSMAKLKDRRNRNLLAAYDTGVLKRNPRNLDFMVRKFAVGYLQAFWESAVNSGEAKRQALLLDSIAKMGYDFAEAHYLVASEKEKKGEYRQAYDSYLTAARLDPKAPFSWDALARVGRMIYFDQRRQSGD